MDEMERQEFSLEDIIREFSDKDYTEAEPSPSEEDTAVTAQESCEENSDAVVDTENDAKEAAAEDVAEVSGEETQVAAEVLEEVTEEITGDIAREVTEEVTGEASVEIAEEVTEEIAAEPVVEIAEEKTEEVPVPLTGDTIRMDISQFSKGIVHNAQPIEEEEIQIPVQEETTEPYSEAWEPDYEQPIAEYVPPRPIVFHPRSKIRELKRKLVAGPEKQYYKLLEKGVGKLQFAAVFCLLLTVLCAIGTALFAFEVMPPERLKFIVFLQFIAMLISALLGYRQLLQGLADLKEKRVSLNTLLVFTFLLCCADGILGLITLRVPCCAAFGLQVTMAIWSAAQRRNTALGQLDTMRKATHLYGLALSEEYCQEGPGLLRTEGKVEDFMDNYRTPPHYTKLISVYTLVAMGVSVAAGVLAGVLHGPFLGVQVAAVTAIAAMPAAMFTIFSRPMAILERRLHSLGAVLCGWSAVETMSKKVLFPVSHDDLFPAGTVKLNGVKFFGQRESDQVVSYGAALVCADKSALGPIFEHLLDSRNGIHYSVDSYQAYASGGIGGQVNDEAVLVGTLPFLQEMGVKIPDGINLNHAVGVGIEGELCGLFALTYDKIRSVASGLGTLCSYRGLRPTITSGDFMLTEEFLKSKFGVNTKRVYFPDFADRMKLQEAQPAEDAVTLAIATNDSMASLAYCVTGSRALRSAARAGLIAQLIGGILGMAMMLVLAFLGAEAYLTPSHLFLYQLVWMVPGLLITEWTRSV